MKHTITSIKKTKVYNANIAAISAIYPGHEEDFAWELMIVANSPCPFYDQPRISAAFLWELTPQSHVAWGKLNGEILKYEATK